MNSIWINHISSYRQTKNCFDSICNILNLKNQRREVMLWNFHILMPHFRIKNYHSSQKIMLAEARASKLFWKNFSLLLPSWCDFRLRMPGSKDITNNLLDIGYHHLFNIIKGVFEKYDISSVLGILHIAQSSTISPLIYDLVEMFRADIVESEVLKFLRMKKVPIYKLESKDISIFLGRINKRLNHRYFLKQHKKCSSYRYYIELQILKFIKSVNHKEVFNPIYLPSRHDDRC